MFKQEQFTRQSDIIPESAHSYPINIIGVGSIGSFLTLQLVKMGYTNIQVWDHDTVDVVNMSCQAYNANQIGMAKVVALVELGAKAALTNQQIIAPHWFKFAPRADLQGVVVLAVDSMQTRQEIVNQLQEVSFRVEYIIDTRMGAESALMYTMQLFNVEDMKSYFRTLYTDSEAVQEPCTAKATMYTACMLAGLVAKTVKNLSLSEDYVRVAQWDIKQNHLQTYTKGQKYE